MVYGYLNVEIKFKKIQYNINTVFFLYKGFVFSIHWPTFAVLLEENTCFLIKKIRSLSCHFSSAGRATDL